MTYDEFISKILLNVVMLNDYNDMWELIPSYRRQIQNLDLKLEDITDYKEATWEEIFEQVKMEIEYHNRQLDKSVDVMNWIYDLIVTSIDPAITDVQNDYIKDVTEYLREKKNIQAKEQALAEKQSALEGKEKIKELVPGMNFSIKKP